jgi:hypothetical protein
MTRVVHVLWTRCLGEGVVILLLLSLDMHQEHISMILPTLLFLAAVLVCLSPGGKISGSGIGSAFTIRGDDSSKYASFFTVQLPRIYVYTRLHPKFLSTVGI